MTEPTDAELIALLGDRQFSTIGAVREALRRWGTPPAVKMEPALHQYQASDGTWNDFDSERHRRDTVAAGYPVRTLYTTPQPTQAQAGAVPLTPEQIKAMDRRHPAEDLCGWSYRLGIADAEAHHGIKGGQHGTE